MSYGMAAALQRAVFERLSGDAVLTAMVGPAVFDTVPPGAMPELFLLLGEEDARDRSDQTGGGAEHRFVVSVLTTEARFTDAKAAAVAASDALVDADFPMTRGRLVGLRFLKARARRIRSEGRRRIDLTFRAFVEDT